MTKGCTENRDPFRKSVGPNQNGPDFTYLLLHSLIILLPQSAIRQQATRPLLLPCLVVIVVVVHYHLLSRQCQLTAASLCPIA